MYKRSYRRNAFEKLAALSAQGSTSGAQDIPKLCSLCTSPPTKSEQGHVFGSSNTAARAPMGVRELEVLLALCRAAPSITSLDHAERLLEQISPYLPEAHDQTFRASPFLREFDPSPWELLSRETTFAILAIALQHPSLHKQAVAVVDRTIDGYVVRGKEIAQAAQLGAKEEGDHDVEGSSQTITFVLSLLGFLESLSASPEAFAFQEQVLLVAKVQQLLTRHFLASVEATLSTIRDVHVQDRSTREWKRVVKVYIAHARPLGALILQNAYMQLVASVTSLMVVSPSAPARGTAILEILLTQKPLVAAVDSSTLTGLTDLIADSVALLETDADYLQLSTAWQQQLAYSTKANCFASYLFCYLVDKDVADSDILMTWLERVLSDDVQLNDAMLASVTLNCLAVLAQTSPVIANDLARSLTRFIAQGNMTPKTFAIATETLAFVLHLLPEEVIIGTLHNLSNVLDATSGSPTRAVTANNLLAVERNPSINGSPGSYSQRAASSTVSLVVSEDEEVTLTQGTVVDAIIAIAKKSQDENIKALALSILVQKMNRAGAPVDPNIVAGSASLGLYGGPDELQSLLKMYQNVATDATAQENSRVIKAVLEARMMLAKNLPKSSLLYELYLIHLLDGIANTSDTLGRETKSGRSAGSPVSQITQLLPPLAALAAFHTGELADFHEPEKISTLCRDMWFNLAMHDFTLGTNLAKQYNKELKILALYAPSLMDVDSAATQETSIDLAFISRRGTNLNHARQLKSQLASVLPNYEAEVKTFEYADLVFLSAARLIAVQRASSGDCTRTLEYFLDPRFKSGGLSSCLVGIAVSAVDRYLAYAVNGRHQAFAAPEIARQLARIFEGCCHRITAVQHVAYACAERMIAQVPSALCQRASLYAMLELLTLLWTSCLEAETDEYEWKSKYHSKKGNVSVYLSDDFSFRQGTLKTFHTRCRKWVAKIMDLAPLDTKGLLQTYLADHDSEEAYGHISLGRSFAVEMGSSVPSTDQRIDATDRQRDLNVNTASDFFAQYTTRQGYRAVDTISNQDQDFIRPNSNGAVQASQGGKDVELREGSAILTTFGRQLRARKQVSRTEARSLLQRAAGLLCNVDSDRFDLVRSLVCVPFAAFTKQAIKLGISLWMGVIKENPRLESRILVEIAVNWEATVRDKQGIFSQNFHYIDPFFIKEEFAPTDKDAMQKRQQHVHDIVAPHFRLMQFLSSHFNATRLTSPNVERVYFRLMRVTLAALRRSPGHPLGREVHFHIILLGLRVLSYTTGSTDKARWELRDQILTAALGWFSCQPRWSYGGNKLQVKAEVHLMSDVIAALQSTASIGSKITTQSLQPKQELLIHLLNNEMSKLSVWLTPLGQGTSSRGLHIGHHKPGVMDSAIAPLVKTAWAVSASLAVQLAVRFPSQQTEHQVRWQLVNNPARAVDEPDALQYLLGLAMPSDISVQLKYLLYWAPVNPITAVTYFLPAYGNHPFIIQYAMRALESHSVDVTFFYVPQIVQTLRYDVLGYAERYIIETAKFSQLFAHQIIWNMKANAYKDDEAGTPDPMKPALDKVETAMLSSFSQTDRDFYEREFGFFNEVTSISGKLKPFIKKSKPEKKQKIEEELQKIPVDVGVYLPSNPDGVVVDIDRKSGKPLQSHAKAPFMATFRIRKELGNMETVDQQIDEAAETGSVTRKENTYEVWQSAIFKVGDDCRQDVLALQMIAAFRGIFNSVGLDVYVFPYRVTATAPGCGVIDVLPNSISRDMLGREQINDLYEYWLSKYGTEDSPRFQAARNNFVKSMAAYSVISYLLQFKDRHNGNIMVDDAGHILHIDFGFIFDIAPGGVKFERAPFKLTAEMVAVMGGSNQAQPFRWFEELCVKAFLASRQHAEKLSHLVVVMLDSGLPCFKPETVRHFKERFVLEKSEREAADFMRMLVHRSERSYSTGVYDQFQLMTNGIPY